MRMRSRGKRNGMPDHSQSAQAYIALAGISVVMASIGVSGEGTGAQDAAPVCRQTTVPVSSQASNSGSQWPLWMDGRRNRWGTRGTPRP